MWDSENPGFLFSFSSSFALNNARIKLKEILRFQKKKIKKDKYHDIKVSTRADKSSFLLKLLAGMLPINL
jgi:hypothetical protein